MGVRRYRRGLLAAMVLTVCLGLASKLENAGAWANYYGGDIVYEMFWIYGLAETELASWCDRSRSFLCHRGDRSFSAGTVS